MARTTFDIPVDAIEFRTQTNGDIIIIRGVHLGATAAGVLAQNINNDIVLECIIKPKNEA